MTKCCRLLSLVTVVSLAACELQEIVIATASDTVVAEVVLHAGSPAQTAYLHRSVTPGGTARVHGARVFIEDQERGGEFELVATDDDVCLVPAPPPALAGVGTCHAATVPADAVRPGATYSLRVELPDRAPLQATTRVPSDFDFVMPSVASCRLSPGTTLPLVWTRADGAWVYVMQARFSGLASALRRQGVSVPPATPEPLDLLGVAIGASDTTMTFPAGFGVFDRASEALHPVLVAIQDGLPSDVETEVVVAAADRNYVNWVRGGSFNPSGTVRVPSVTGADPAAGTGLFGSLVTRSVRIRTAIGGVPCL
ncbi:MAG TPA: hypothetical protein VK929_08280 [Longimicrobiales bacterium]|nr:hypothetical protein [Longimicrobiales bacterium]